MVMSVPESLKRVLLCAMLLGAPGALAQTTSTSTPSTATSPPAAKQAAPKPKATPATKPTPVVKPRGAAHPQKPAPKPPAAAAAPPAAAPPPAPPEPPKETEAETVKGSNTGLPLPRFAALRSDEVNLRAGPGTRYPIEWVYKRRELPVEILREFEVWRLVQDPDGIKGWVHQATLTGRRSFIVTGADATLLRDPQDGARPVAILKVGVTGHIRTCPAGSDWCQVQAGDYRGWLKRRQLWGTLPGEVVAP
jgi:SH3-like domain-containing protein